MRDAVEPQSKETKPKPRGEDRTFTLSCRNESQRGQDGPSEWRGAETGKSMDAEGIAYAKVRNRAPTGVMSAACQALCRGTQGADKIKIPKSGRLSKRQPVQGSETQPGEVWGVWHSPPCAPTASLPFSRGTSSCVLELLFNVWHIVVYPQYIFDE